MRYVDTSILIAYLTRESGSALAEQFMRSAGEPLAISSWTEVELMSALGMKLRTQALNLDAVQDVLHAYSAWVAPQLLRLPVDDADHRQAVLSMNGWASTLRAGDALHLAIASAHGATVHTLDRGMANAGKILGIPVELLGQDGQ